MGVYIKNMEMPKSCFDCPLSYVFPYSEDNFMVKCAPLNRKSSEDTKRNDCPLIEMPAPHGRLIDADAVSKRMCELKLERGSIQWDMAAEVITQMAMSPTIIESETN